MWFLAAAIIIEGVCLFRLWQEQERQAYRVQVIYQILWEMNRIKKLEEEERKCTSASIADVEP